MILGHELFKALSPASVFPERIAPYCTGAHLQAAADQGDVHDPGAAMFGGVAGHAGLFSDAYDLAILDRCS